MTIVIRVIQGLLILAGLAAAIGALTVIGGLVNDTDLCVPAEDRQTVDCARYQVQATVGIGYALVAMAAMIGAVAMNGMVPAARPAPGGAVAHPQTGPFPVPGSAPTAYPPAGQYPQAGPGPRQYLPPPGTQPPGT